MKTRATCRPIGPCSRNGCSRRATAPPRSCRRSRSPGALASRADSIGTTTTSCRAGQAERSAKDTTDAALSELGAPPAQPLFLWVHYYDPHAPYAPPEPYRTQVRGARRTSAKWRRWTSSSDGCPGVRARRDRAVGDRRRRRPRRRARRSRRSAARHAAVPVDDARAARGDRARASPPASSDDAGEHAPHLRHGARLGRASTRRTACSSRRQTIVLGEAMKPFLEYGWQPQVMAVDGTVQGDPRGHDRDLRSRRRSRARRAISARRGDRRSPCAAALDDYPVPSPEAARAPAALDDEAQRKLASLGYVGASAAPVVRKDAPRPAT